jgi:hypothetical protein
MRVAQAYLAALARDWDDHLAALRHHLGAPPGDLAP